MAINSGPKSQTGGQNIKAFFNLDENWYNAIFEVADCKSEIKTTWEKMPDPIWRIHMLEKYPICDVADYESKVKSTRDERTD